MTNSLDDLQKGFRVCYVLADDEAGTYARMLRINLALLRRVEPERAALVLTDREPNAATAAALAAAGAAVRVVPSDRPNARLRSRELKTRLRALTEGPILFLDLDALPIRPLDLPAPGPTEAFAAARERRPPRGRPQSAPPEWNALFAPAGLQSPDGQPVYNSGVTLWPDSPAARDLAERWHRCWSRLVAAGTTYRDQHALAWAVRDAGASVRELPAKWNALVHLRPFDAFGARVLHFVHDGGNASAETLLGQLMTHHERTGEIDWPAVEAARRGRVWRRPGESLKRAVILRRYDLLARELGRRLRERFRPR